VNNLPKVVTWHCTKRKSNLYLAVTSPARYHYTTKRHTEMYHFKLTLSVLHCSKPTLHMVLTLSVTIIPGLTKTVKTFFQDLLKASQHLNMKTNWTRIGRYFSIFLRDLEAS